MGRRSGELENMQAEMRARWQAGGVRLRPGRPPCQLDEELVFIWALHGLTQAEIASKLGCDPKTLRRHCGPVLQQAARSRAALLPRALWQRGLNRPEHLAARFAETIQRQEQSLDELAAMLWADPPEAGDFDGELWPGEGSNPDLAARLQTSVLQPQIPEQLRPPKDLSREFFPQERVPTKARRDSPRG